MHIFLGSEIKKIVFKVFLYVIVWWVYHFFLLARFSLFPICLSWCCQYGTFHLALTATKAFAVFSHRSFSEKGAAGWAVRRAPPPEGGRFLQHLWFLTLNLAQVTSGAAPLQQCASPQCQRLQIMLILFKNASQPYCFPRVNYLAV